MSLPFLLLLSVIVDSKGDLSANTCCALPNLVARGNFRWNPQLPSCNVVFGIFLQNTIVQTEISILGREKMTIV
jgi:hypothetical protein